MNTLALAAIILLELITYLVIADVILSWLLLIGIKRPMFISNTLDPIYKIIKEYIPTTIGPFELTPIIIIILLMFIKVIIITLFPEIQSEYLNITKNI